MKKILKNYLKVCCLASAIVLVPACEQPLDPVLESVQETNETLQKHTWTLEDFRIELKDDDIPPPILFSLTDAEISGGVYDLDDMVLDASDARKLQLRFTPEKEIVHISPDNEQYIKLIHNGEFLLGAITLGIRGISFRLEKIIKKQQSIKDLLPDLEKPNWENLKKIKISN